MPTIPIPPRADVDVQNAFKETEKWLRALEAKSKTLGLSANERQAIDIIRKDVDRLKRSKDHNEITGETTFVSLVNFLENTSFSGTDVAFSDDTRLWGTGLDRLPWDEQSPTGAVDIWNLRGALHTDGPIHVGGIVTGDAYFTGTVVGVDHGGLDGLADDDHTQYFLADGSRNLGGDITPDGDNTRDVGTSSAKVAEVHTYEVFPELFLFEDFICGSNATSTTIGQLGWSAYTSGGGGVSGSSVNYSGHPGNLSLSIGTTDNAVTAIYHHATRYGTRLDDVARVDWVVQPLTTLGKAFRCQLSTSVSTENPNGSLGFEWVTGDTNWYAISTDGSGSTRTDTGVTAAVSTWFKFEVRRTGAQTWKYYIDDALVATHTGSGNNVPADSTGIQVIVQAKSGGSGAFHQIDRIRAWTSAER